MQGSCGGGEAKTGRRAAAGWSIIPAKAVMPATGKGVAVHIRPLPCQHSHEGPVGCHPWGCQGVGQTLRKEKS